LSRPDAPREEREEKIMNIIIHESDGYSELTGMADHLSAEENLRRNGYALYPDVVVPSGDYGDGTLMCVRHEAMEYADDQYDVAEF
jgi:hypothetical protein